VGGEELPTRGDSRSEPQIPSLQRSALKHAAAPFGSRSQHLRAAHDGCRQIVSFSKLLDVSEILSTSRWPSKYPKISLTTRPDLPSGLVNPEDQSSSADPMIQLRLLTAALLLLGRGAALEVPCPPDDVDELQAQSMDKLRDFLAQNPAAGGCNLDNAVRRREWCVDRASERDVLR